MAWAELYEHLMCSPLVPPDAETLREAISRKRNEQIQGFVGVDALTAFLQVALQRTAHRLRQAEEQVLRQHGLAAARWHILSRLYFIPGATLPLSILSEWFGFSRPNMTGLIDGLERDGLVERVMNKNDRRMVMARLTDDGRAKVCEITPQVHAAVSQLLAVYDDEEKERMLELAVRLHPDMAIWIAAGPIHYPDSPEPADAPDLFDLPLERNEP